MKTEIFDTYSDFLNRKDKSVNGVSKEFAENNPHWENDNVTNNGCWNCSDCSGCSDIKENSKYVCIINMYKYVCCPRLEADGTQKIQMGCFLRTRKEWEDDFWNNNKEFLNDGSEKSNNRKKAFEFACLWLDSVSSTQEKAE